MLTSEDPVFFVRGRYLVLVDGALFVVGFGAITIGWWLLFGTGIPQAATAGIISVLIGIFVVGCAFANLINLKHSFVRFDGQTLEFKYSRWRCRTFDINSINEVFIGTDDDLVIKTHDATVTAPMILSTNEQALLISLLQDSLRKCSNRQVKRRHPQ